MDGKCLKAKKKSQLCSTCGKSFRDSYNLQRHFRNAHESESECLLCDYRSSESDVCKHYEDKHDLTFDVQNHVFGSFEDFKKWKDSYEGSNLTKYLKGSVRRNKDGSIVTYYKCHRDGFYKSKSNSCRSTKSIGSNKINARCPSYMRLHRIKDAFNLKFLSTHIGHTNDLHRIPLSQKDKTSIVEEIIKGTPVNDIIDNIRDSINSQNIQRIHLTTKKDINNIISTYNLCKYAKMNTQNNKSKNTIKNSRNEESSILTPSQEILNNKSNPFTSYDNCTELPENIYEKVTPFNTVESKNKSASELDKKKGDFLDKINRLLDMVECVEDMESVVRHAAPLDSIFRCLKQRNIVNRGAVKFKNDSSTQSDSLDLESGNSLINPNIAYEIVIE